MWYVKDEFSNKIYFKSNDVRETQNFVKRHNNSFKFSGQRMFNFVLSSFTGPFVWPSTYDINVFTRPYSMLVDCKFTHPLSIKGYNKRHLLYVERKLKLLRHLAKKYHVWSYNESGRKCDGFDF